MSDRVAHELGEEEKEGGCWTFEAARAGES